MISFRSYLVLSTLSLLSASMVLLTMAGGAGNGLTGND